MGASQHKGELRSDQTSRPLIASAIETADGDRVKRTALVLLKDFASQHESCGFVVRFWDSAEFVTTAAPQFTLIIHSARALRNLFYSPNELTLGESFIVGDLDVEGDFAAALHFAKALMAYKPKSSRQVVLQMLDRALNGRRYTLRRRDGHLKGELHSRLRDQAAVASHYDLSNDFYRLWLDPHMQYSAAYFESPDEDLDQAQVSKLGYICRKMRLHPGDRLLDIGCGWGGLILYAAWHHQVHAHGITLSQNQAELASERIQIAGLENRCLVRICDYRDVANFEGYDKIVSVGMFEHVGRSMLETYFRHAWRLLRPGGLFLNSGIAASKTWEMHGPSFMDHYVFPDGELVPLSTTIEEAENCGFEVRDVECHREHYALTLDRWVQRLEEHAEVARRLTDDVTYRTWRLYMAASADAFREGRVNLYHVLMTKPKNGACELPLTSRDLYQ